MTPTAVRARTALSVLGAVALAAVAGARASGAPASPPPVRYTLGLLVRGPTWTAERTPRTDSIQAGHRANIRRMWEHGALLAAGPFEDGGDLRGVFVFRPGDDPLDSLLAGDPAIASGRLVVRRLPWIGPAGIGDDYRRRTAERAAQGLAPQDSMVTHGWVMLERGPRYDSNPSPKVRRLIERHAAHTERLRASGRLLFAGAIEGTGELRGVLVLEGDSAQVARDVAADPAVRAGRFMPRILRWWTAWGTLPGH